MNVNDCISRATFGIMAERNLNLLNDDRGSKSVMKKMKLNGVLLITKQYSNLPLYSIRSPFFFSSHSPRHAHTERHKRRRAGCLTGPILELARYSNKTDRPTNYPQNYNILMFQAQSAVVWRTVSAHGCVRTCLVFGMPACAAEELFIMQTAGGGLLHVK